MFWKIYIDFEKFIEEKSMCLIVTHGLKWVGNNETALDSGYILNFGQIWWKDIVAQLNPYGTSKEIWRNISFGVNGSLRAKKYFLSIIYFYTPESNIYE